MIEAGASEYELSSDWGSSKPVTEELKRNFKKASNLNPEQIEALNIAINTPDIALIQGPPGTGKTTVIKAICERFREIFEAEERKLQKDDPEHALRSPKILISSFQNEAVDNAISTPLPGDIPAYRKTAKRAKDSTKEQYQKALESWYTGVRKSIGELIEDKAAAEFVENKKKLSDEYLSYKNSGETLELASVLIKHYLSFTEITYPKELIDAANTVIKAVDTGDDFDDLPDPVVAKLESQRIDKESFEDDGLINAKRLLAHLRIRDDLEIEECDIDAIAKVCGPDATVKDFNEYVSAVIKLQKRLCKVKNSININVTILPLTMFDINSFRRLQNVMLRQIVSLNTGHCPCCGGEMRGRDNQMVCDNCNQMMLTKTICPNPDCRHEYYYLSFDVSAETLSKMKDVDPDNFYQVDSLYQYKDIVNMSVDTGKIRTICPHCGQ